MGVLVFLNAFVVSGCYKNHLYVQQEHLSREWLASSHVGTPDPRQSDPPVGEKLIVAWDFPLSLFEEQLRLDVVVRFWDQSERVVSYVLPRKRGVESFGFDESENILTYRVQVLNGQGVCLEEWKHHFWTELIRIE